MMTVSVKPTPPPEGKQLRILALPDLHIPLGMPSKACLLAWREFLKKQDWVVLLGDMAACYGTPGEYAEVNAFVSALKRPYDVVNGNHEFSFVPQTDGAPTYGRVWEHADTLQQQAQLRRFESFYQIDARCRLHVHSLADLALVGVDGNDARASAVLDHDHTRWLEQAIARSPQKSLVVFCHYPVADARLDHIRYYAPERRPYYLPPPSLRRALHDRPGPVFWISGHVHFAPSHPLAEPYQTADGVWQVHCPDGWGFGRADDTHWTPLPHEDVHVQRLELSAKRFRVVSVDVRRKREQPIFSFELPVGHDVHCGPSA